MPCSKPRVLAAASLLIAVAACGGKPAESKKEAPAPSAPVAVRTVRVAEESFPQVYEATGTLRARVTSTLSARLMGHVQEVRVQTGDSVKAGQLLVVLDAREIETAYLQAQAARAEARSGLPEVQNAIAAAKAQLDLADKTYARMKELFEKKSISNQEFDEASARREMAQANYEMAVARRAQLDAKIQQTDQAVATIAVQRGYAQVTAPFNGMVMERKAEPGTLASPGLPLLVLEQAGAYRFEASVEEARLGSVHLGDKVMVRLDSVDRDLPARVSEIVPSVDAASRAFTVKIDLPQIAGLRSGLFGRALFAQGVRKGLFIPAAAIKESGQVLSVYVAGDGNIARSRLVTIGAKWDDRVEVLSGLTSGESVVAPLPPAFADGARIEVRR
jgi:RND family efflux transporter MFP subunit